jgi:uncharacterized protein (TIGR02145 family)
LLTDALGSSDMVGNKLKSTSGWMDNGKSNNSSSFSGLPGGLRSYSGHFNSVGIRGFWWSSSEYDTYGAWVRSLGGNSGIVGQNYNDKRHGFSVRCLRD